MDPINAEQRIFPPEFITRDVPDPPADNASAIVQRNRNEAIKREKKYNEHVPKSKAILVEILSSSVSISL